MKTQPTKENATAAEHRGASSSTRPMNNSSLGKLQVHPVADWFPEMPEAEFAELKADIEKRGLREPILVKHGHILDGRHRYRACCELGIEPKSIEYDGSADILDEIFSRNLFRRHLNDDQRAMMVAKLRGGSASADAHARQTSSLRKGNQIPVGLKTNQRGRTREQIAQEARVSVGKAQTALRVLKTKPAVVDKIIAGKKRLAEVKVKSKWSPKKEKPFEQQVWDKWLQFMGRWPQPEHRKVKQELRRILLSRKNDTANPVSALVTYEDKSTENFNLTNGY